MKCKYIQLKTYGRTGSNLISNYFAAVGYHTLNSHETTKITDQISSGREAIIHDHSYDYIIPQVGKTSICLFLKRRDITSQLLSMIVAKHFDFYHDVDTTLIDGDREKPDQIEKFTLGKRVCLAEARVFTEWHYKANINLANSQIHYMTLYYEDYVDRIEQYFSFLHDRPGFKLMESAEKKNSIQSKDIIENYDEVVEWLANWNLSSGIYI